MNKKIISIILLGFILSIQTQAQLLLDNSNNNNNLSIIQGLLRNSDRFLQNPTLTITPTETSFISGSHITFSGLSSPQDVVKIELFNSSQSINLQFLQASSNSILALFNGGYSGVFQGRITLSSGIVIVSYNTINIRVKIDSISPNQGSNQGGVLLTINGSNFSYYSSLMQVFIGNIQCTVLTSTDTQIQCVTQPALNLVNQQVNVVIKSGNLVSTTDNPSNILFKFINIAQQPIITSIKSATNKFFRSDIVQITGQNLFAQGITTLLYIGSTNVLFSQNNQGLTFIIPNDISSQLTQLVIYVGQNGSTQPQNFQIGYILNYLFGLNPDKTLYVSRYGEFQLYGSVQGLSKKSQIQLQLDSGSLSDFNLLIMNNVFYIQGTFDHSLSQAPTKITQLNIDGQNYLSNPITFLSQQDQIMVSFSIKIHPTDSKFFQMKLMPNAQYPNLTVQSLVVQDFQAKIVDQLIQESANTFKYLRFSSNYTDISFVAYTNQGVAQYYGGSSAMYLIQVQITKLTQTQNVKTGDILQFQISQPSTKFVYTMNVMCPNGYNDQISSYFKGLDIYQVLPFQQKGNVYSFYFPTITQRLSTAQSTCDIYIAETDLTFATQSQYEYIQFFLNQDFINSFLKEPNQSPQIDVNPNLQVGFTRTTYFLQQFKNAVTPQKQRIYVQDIQPQTLSANGGEQVVITGNNFLANSNTVQTTQVTLFGVSCQVTSLSNTQITCISGQKANYKLPEDVSQYTFRRGLQVKRQDTLLDGFDKTQILIGNESALLLTHVNLKIDFSDQYQVRLLKNQFLDQQTLFVPYNLNLTLDVGLYTGNQINFNKIYVDGQLIIISSRDLNIHIQQIDGLGSISFGSSQQNINSNVNIVIDSGCTNLNAYGKNVQSYNYKLKSALNAQSSVIEVADSSINLQPGNKIMVLATSLDEVNEEFVIQSVKGNLITVATPAQYTHTNTIETHTQQNGSVRQFNIQVPVVQSDRNLSIKLNSCSFKNIYNARIESSNSLEANIIMNSFVVINSKPTDSQVQINSQNIQNSVISISNSPFLISSNFQNNFVILSQPINTLSVDSSVFINNYLQAGIINYSQQTSKYANNLIVSSNYCFSQQYVQTVQADQNICFSTNSFTQNMFPQMIQTNDLAFSVLDLRQYLIRNQASMLTSQQNDKFAFAPDSSNKTKFFVVANTNSKPAKNQPVLQLNDNAYNFFQSIIQNFELQGFINTQQLIQYADQMGQYFRQGAFIIDILNLKSDINQSTQLFNPTINDQLRNLIVVDRDGSLTGKPQNVISSNLVVPSLNCALNVNNLNSCMSQIGVFQLSTLGNQNGIPQTTQCQNTLSDNPIAILDGTTYTSDQNESLNTFAVGLTGQINFRFINRIYHNQEYIPCYFNLEPIFIQDLTKSFIVKYMVDTSKWSLNVYVKQESKYIWMTSVSSLDVNTCNLGDYLIQNDGVQICIQSTSGYLYGLGISVSQIL
ncbi:IPT/TIG domain protein (macronuclear) [Tetrahymena thermophila SB210]|uniref:IPT/TIG domain protein n=1 Tax=Tetrahymena thermophila (strain SB210) TaxID=312017 RepID=I7LUI6_TETTS|nr:IPT/TIG domain protein [Tetrahymena thermophila SB210]EAR93844.2 IPT/TIG domain protein [Tetrahymena thermophila SB210]|eukprot:XP_001014089.2 IPT/TIG domain protein [Tetrahymena thermophila SB210]